MPDFTGTKDLRSYLRVAWRWKWLILAFVVGAPLAAYLVESGQPKVYDSSALVGVNQTSTPVVSGGSFSTSNVTAIAELVPTTPVADVAAALLHPPASPDQIAGEVSTSGDPTTNFITITAQDRSPVRAAAIANAFARAITLNQRQAAISGINEAINGVNRQLAHLSPTDTTTRPALEQELSQLKTSLATQTSAAAILNPATPSSTPAGPKTRRSVEIGLLIGLLLAIGAVVLAESADRRLRSPEDLEGMTGLPLLAAIAPTAFSGELETSREDDEAFQMLRTALMYFNVDRRLDSIVITSAGEKEGKTTVAIRLALATAGAGLDVVLVDGDLRRAQVSGRLGLQASEGLGAVLSGTREWEEVLVDFPSDESAHGRLRVLPAGSSPPNPSALMSSKQMQSTLKELEAESDLVIVDTPAALAVSDPLPLMRSVSGVVLIARMNQSSRQTVRRLKKIVESAHGTLLGVVATGVTAGEGYYEHYATKYYTHNGSSNGSGGRHLLARHKHIEADADAQAHE